MMTLFVVGTFWFWLLVVAEFLFLCGFVFNEKGFLATCSLLIFGAALQFLGDANILGYAWSHPWTILAASGIYLFVGFFWAIFKWRNYVIERRDAYLDVKRAFLKSHHLSEYTETIPAEFAKDWKRVAQAFAKAPLVKEHKSDWMMWAAYWPVSMACYLIADFIVNIFKKMFKLAEFAMQRMSEKIWSDVYKDINVD